VKKEEEGGRRRKVMECTDREETREIRGEDEAKERVPFEHKCYRKLTRRDKKRSKRTWS